MTSWERIQRRKQKGYEVSYRPDIMYAKLQKKHDQMVKDFGESHQLISIAIAVAKRVCDERGIFGNYRLGYICFAEEIAKLLQKFSGKALLIEADAIFMKYVMYGYDEEILRQVARELGIEVGRMLKQSLLEALEEAPTLRTPVVEQNPLDIKFEYDHEGKPIKATITDIETGKKKIIEFIYDAEGKLVDVKESRG